jgi:hypothetical protein
VRDTSAERFVRFWIVHFAGFADDDIETQRSGTSSRGIHETLIAQPTGGGYFTVHANAVHFVTFSS